MHHFRQPENQNVQETADAEGYEGDRKKKKPGSGEKSFETQHQIAQLSAVKPLSPSGRGVGERGRGV